MLKKSSPLKHKEAGHMLLTDEAHQKEHGNDVDILEEPKKEEVKTEEVKKEEPKKEEPKYGDDDFEHITQEEFEIWDPKTGLINKDENATWHDDVEGLLVKKLRKKYGDSGFEFDTAGIGHNMLEVTTPDGKPTKIALNSGWDGPVNPQAHQQLMGVLESNIDPEKKKVFDKTGLNPNEDGNYDLEIETGAEKQSYMGKVVDIPTIEKSIKPDEVLDIAANIEGEITKALTSVDKSGNFVEYPGLEQRASTTRLENLSPENESNIKEAVFKQVNKDSDRRISKDSFEKIWNRGLYNQVKGKIQDEFSYNNSVGLLSDKEINQDFINEQEGLYHNKLKGKNIYKQEFVSQITEEQNNIKRYTEQIKLLDPTDDKEKIESLNQSIEDSNTNIDDYDKQIENLGKRDKKLLYINKAGQPVYRDQEDDEDIASSLFDNSGMSDERRKRIDKAVKDQKTTTDPELAAIKATNTKLSDKEAMKELWDLKALRKQQLVKESKEKFINVNPDEYGWGVIATGKDLEFKKFIRNAKENGLVGDDGTIKMSLYDLMTKFDQDAREFDNWYDPGSNMMSEEDVELLREFESGMDHNEGQMQAVYEMYFLNRDPGEMEKPSLLKTGVQAATEAMGREWFGMSETESQNLATLGQGPRTQIMMDKMNEAQADVNEKIDQGLVDGEKLVWSKEQMENMERTFGEEVAEGVGNFVPMLIELGVVSAISGGVGSVTGLTPIMGALRAGKHGKKGKMGYHAMMAGWEEAKMQAIFELPPTGGAMFYAGGAATRGITPFKPGSRFAWMDPVFQKIIKGGVIGATSAEAAHITEMAYDDLMDHDDFKAKFDENFGDMSENTRRYAVNAIVFGLTGVTHVKKGDLKSTGGKYRAIAEMKKEQQYILDNPEGTKADMGKVIEKGLKGPGAFYEGKPEGYENLSLKQQSKYDALAENAVLLEQQAMRESHNAKLDPKSENFEQDFNRMVAEPMNEAIKAVVPEHKGFKIRFTENRKEFETDSRGKDLGNTAEFNPKTNEIIFDKNAYTAGKPIHEFTHAALRAYFAKNPQLEFNFTEKMETLFKDFDFKTKDGTKLGDAILEHYGRKEGEGVDMRTKEGKKLKSEEFLAHMSELLSDPAIYHQKVAPTFFKEAKQEITSIMEENFGYTPQIKTAGDFVNLLGRLSQDARRGLKFKNKASRMAELDKIGFLGIEYSVERQKKEEAALGSRNLELEKQELLNKQKELVSQKDYSKKEFEANKKQIVKLTENIEKSKVNQEFTEKYKEAKEEQKETLENKELVKRKQKEIDAIDKSKFSEDPITRDWQYGEAVNKIEQKYKPSTAKIDKAIEVLKENNKGILTNYVKNFYKDVPGSEMSRSDFKKYVENVEFEKILGTYSRRGKEYKDVPFNDYLKGVLEGGGVYGGGRMGNILKAHGIDMDKRIKTVSRDAEGYNEKEQGETGGGSFSRETPGGTQGIELVYKLPVSTKHIDAIRAEYPKYEPKIKAKKLYFKDLPDVAKDLTKEMIGKTTNEKALFLTEHWETAHTTNPLSFNPITATSNRVPGRILDKLYGEGRRLKSIDFGKNIDALSPKQRKAADAGLPVQDKLPLPNPVKSSKVNKDWYLEKFGIKDNRSKKEINEFLEQKKVLEAEGNTTDLKELIESQIGKDKLDISGMDRNIKETQLPGQTKILGEAITAQVFAEHHLDLNRDAAGKVLDKARGEVHQFRAGKPKGLASRNLEGQRFEDQVKVLEAAQTPEFKALFDRNLKIPYSKKDNAVSKTLLDYFELNKDKDLGINNKDLKKIGEEINKEFQFGKITPLKIASKAAKAIELPNELHNIEKKYGLDKLKSGTTFEDLGDILEGQMLDKKLAKYLTKQYGAGAYEAIMLNATSGGSGLGPFREVADAAIGLKDRNRYAIWRSANKKNRGEMDVYNMLDGVYAEMGGKENIKSFEGMTREQSNRQGERDKLMKVVVDAKGEFNVEQAKKEYEFGEKNKKVLKDVVEQVADLYDKELIDHRQARQWVEMHAGNMNGLIKKAASLAVLPEGKKAELEKRYGKEWVLEHTTPAKYVKARIYDYILSGKSAKAKKAMDLTIRDMHTTFIPKTLDKMVNKILQDNLPSNHIPGMDPLFSRYYLANHVSNFNVGLKNFITGKEYKASGNLNAKELQQAAEALRKHNLSLFPKEFKALASRDINSKIQDRLKNIEEAARKGKAKKKKPKGMSTFDFDETVGISDNYIIAKKGKQTKKISSSDWPIVGEQLKNEGWKMDFTDFNKVTKGKPGPLMEKLKNQITKFGNKNVFILTARAPESAPAIHEWLKSEGVKLPLKNISGLGNSTGEAKALWMLKKFSEGYNDMYFVDDALPNVKAVKNVLGQLDVKSNVQRVLASKNLNNDFNQIIEDVKGVGREKEYKDVTAKMMGAKKGKYKWVIPPSAADFELLTSYTFAGKGKQGEAHQKWWNDNLFKPFARGINDINTAKQATANDYLALRKLMPGARKMLKKKVAGTGFTHDAAIRVHRWTESGFEVPGINKKDLKLLNDVVNNNPELKAFSDGLGKISKTKEGWVEPTEHWLTENITADLHAVTTRVGRKQHLAEWIENKNIVFSKKNMNKIEALYGKGHRDALEDMLYRMEHGTNRTTGRNALTNKFMNWTNNSVGAVMFFNMRSAGLQLLSSVNYINHAENNIFKAGKAFANQPQYWKDFATIYNSDMLKQRRAGLKMNVNEAEIAAAVEGSSNKAQAALSWLLKKGFTPTQLADSFAIASGGATFYRNRLKMYEKQGLETKEAKKKAWTDFQEIAEKTQQSARPDLISQQQASPLGRLILAFANTPMQYARIMKKGAMDLSSGRGDPKAHVSRILYYGGIQGMIFASLQSGMFSMLFDDELDEDYIDKKQERVLNTMTDGLLRGTGVAGASVSAIKNGVIRFMNENEKGYNQDYMNVVVDMLNVSPTIGSKVRKLKSAGDSYKWNKDVIPEMGFDIENPGIYSAANVVSATTNVPLDRLVTKVNNLKGAIDTENETWQRIAMFMGYNRWDLGMDKPEAVVEAKKVVKEKKKVIAKEKREEKKKIELKEKEKEGEEKQEQQKKEGKQVTCLVCKLPIAEGKKYCTIHEKKEQNETGKKAQCKKVKTDGSQCKMQTSNKSGLCYYHD